MNDLEIKCKDIFEKEGLEGVIAYCKSIEYKLWGLCKSCNSMNPCASNSTCLVCSNSISEYQQTGVVVEEVTSGCGCVPVIAYKAEKYFCIDDWINLIEGVKDLYVESMEGTCPKCSQKVEYNRYLVLKPQNIPNI